jgi:tRNA(fMet)-specific endonuclease VapC
VNRRLLDTNIWIALAREEHGVVARLRKLIPAQVVSCAIVRAELIFGARNSQRVAENLAGFHRLLQPFVSLPFDDRAADHYGIIRATLEHAGTPIGANDLLIASIAIAHDCILVTRNSREFERVVGLRVEVWPASAVQ